MAHLELYRKSLLGLTLTETLDELVTDGSLPPQLALKILVEFDKVCPCSPLSRAVLGSCMSLIIVDKAAWWTFPNDVPVAVR